MCERDEFQVYLPLLPLSGPRFPPQETGNSRVPAPSAPSAQRGPTVGRTPPPAFPRLSGRLAPAPSAPKRAPELPSAAPKRGSPSRRRSQKSGSALLPGGANADAALPLVVTQIRPAHWMTHFLFSRPARCHGAAGASVRLGSARFPAALRAAGERASASCPAVTDRDPGGGRAGGQRTPRHGRDSAGTSYCPARASVSPVCRTGRVSSWPRMRAPSSDILTGMLPLPFTGCWILGKSLSGAEPLSSVKRGNSPWETASL